MKYLDRMKVAYQELGAIIDILGDSVKYEGCFYAHHSVPDDVQDIIHSAHAILNDTSRGLAAIRSKIPPIIKNYLEIKEKDRLYEEFMEEK